MPRRRLRALLVILGSSLAALAAAEGVMVWLDLFDPPVFAKHPSYGYLMRPNQSVSTRGRRFRINGSGFRGPDVSATRNPATYRLAFLGDSITFGGGSVSDAEIFPDRVRSLLSEQTGRAIEVVNISAPGWAIENMARYVEANGTFDSDMVVWVIPAVDFRRPFSQIEYHFFPTREPLFRLQYLFMLAEYQVARRLGWAGVWPTTDPDDVLRGNLATLRAMFPMWQRAGVTPIMVLVPGRDGYGDAKDLAQFRRVASDCDVPVLDTAQALLGTSPSSFFDEMHLSAHGHEAAATAIAGFVREIAVRPAETSRPAVVPPFACALAITKGAS